jgi:hypothetical protein
MIRTISIAARATIHLPDCAVDWTAGSLVIEDVDDRPDPKAGSSGIGRRLDPHRVTVEYWQASFAARLPGSIVTP